MVNELPNTVTESNLTRYPSISDTPIFLAIFTMVGVLYFASTVGVMNSIDGPQYALTRAIVDRHTLRLEGYDWVDPDHALVNGIKYTKRNPGVSFLAIPFYVYSKALASHLFPPYYGEQMPGVDADSPLEAMTYGLVSLVA